MDEEYTYWNIDFISCEGNIIWTVARTPSDWISDNVRESFTMGGCGDDPAEIISIEETGNEDYEYDYT